MTTKDIKLHKSEVNTILRLLKKERIRIYRREDNVARSRFGQIVSIEDKLLKLKEGLE